MSRIGGWILEILKSPEDGALGERIREEIAEFAKAFPVPGIEGN